MSTAFHDRLVQIGIDGFLAGAIALGSKLGLFKALGEVSSEKSPATPKMVADKANCKERYVKEWLCLLASSDIIEVNEEEQFWIKPENVEELCGNGEAQMFNSFVPCFLKSWHKLAECFTKDGPLGLNYSDFSDFYAIMEGFSEILHKKHLVSDFLPMLGDDLIDRLEKGDVMCLDVGCGNGFHAALLAERFPKSNFTGIDITLDAVLTATQKRKEDGKTFDNLAFIQMDAGKMEEDWTDKYDVVFIFDACHDQMRPDLCLKEIHRVLKPGGVFGMLETNGFSNAFKDKKEMGMTSTVLYSCSMYHCLPVGSNCPGAICAGAMWGNKMATRMLGEAGFSDVKVLPTPQFAINQLYVCRK